MEVSVAESYARILCAANQEYHYGKSACMNMGCAAWALHSSHINSTCVQSHSILTLEQVSLNAGYVLARIFI